MEIYQAFDKTLRDLGIRAAHVASTSGVSDADISRFRNGDQDIRTSKMARLIAALPSHAQDYFWYLFRYSDLGVRCMIAGESGARYGPAPSCDVQDNSKESAAMRA